MIPLPSKTGYTVYTKTNCSTCETLRNVLPKATWVNCDEWLDDVDTFLEFMDSISDSQAIKFPMVFLDGQFVTNSTKHVKHVKPADFSTTASF